MNVLLIVYLLVKEPCGKNKYLHHLFFPNVPDLNSSSLHGLIQCWHLGGLRVYIVFAKTFYFLTCALFFSETKHKFYSSEASVSQRFLYQQWFMLAYISCPRRDTGWCLKMQNVKIHVQMTLFLFAKHLLLIPTVSMFWIRCSVCCFSQEM